MKNTLQDSIYSSIHDIDVLNGLWVNSLYFSRKRRLVEAQIDSLLNKASLEKLVNYREKVYSGTRVEQKIDNKIISATMDFIPTSNDSSELSNLMIYIFNNKIGTFNQRLKISKEGQIRLGLLMESNSAVKNFALLLDVKSQTLKKY